MGRKATEATDYTAPKELGQPIGLYARISFERMSHAWEKSYEDIFLNTLSWRIGFG